MNLKASPIYVPPVGEEELQVICWKKTETHRLEKLIR